MKSICFACDTPGCCPTVSDRPAISFTRILEFSSGAAGRTQSPYAYACRAVNSACTQKRVFRAHKRRQLYTHVRAHTRTRVYTPGRCNTGKVACQTGIICNAAVVVVVGLNYIVALLPPGRPSLLHSLSSSRLFLPDALSSPLRPSPACSSCFFPSSFQPPRPPYDRSLEGGRIEVAVFHRRVPPSRSKDK